MSIYDREPLYVISVAARLLGMHAQTLRKYERERFIEPSRTKGRLRLYSSEDIERLRQIKYLVEDQGLNLSGVQLALTLSRRLQQLPDQLRGARSAAEAAALCEREVASMLALLGIPEPEDHTASMHGARLAPEASTPSTSPLHRRAENRMGR